MSAIIDGLLNGWNKNDDYAQRLIADLTAEQMTAQIAPADGEPANHPAWILSHLNAYLPPIQSLIKGESFDDPKNHPFGMLSKPELDPSIYADKDTLLAEWSAGHETVRQLLQSADDSIFEMDVQLERWKDLMPKVGIALPYVMLCHENMHLGQISAWRRIQGMPSV